MTFGTRPPSLHVYSRKKYDVVKTLHHYEINSNSLKHKRKKVYNLIPRLNILVGTPNVFDDKLYSNTGRTPIIRRCADLRHSR